MVCVQLSRLCRVIAAGWGVRRTVGGYTYRPFQAPAQEVFCVQHRAHEVSSGPTHEEIWR